LKGRDVPGSLARSLEESWYSSRTLRWVLSPLELLYRFAWAARRLGYRLGLRKVVKLPVTVIVIGNITVGGTGKTPCVIWMATQLRTRGYRVGVLSRGYGGRAKTWPRWVDVNGDPEQVGDEALLLASGGWPVAVGRDRVAAGRMLLAEQPLDVLLCDDGLQHYALHRDMEIAVIDGTRGLGNGACLPAGPLREPRTRLRSVDAIIVNGGRWVDGAAFRAELAPRRVYAIAGGQERDLAAFRDTVVHAVAGIGHPARFFDMLKAARIRVIPHSFTDHARYAGADFDFGDGHPILMTEKDAVKCRVFADDRFWCVTVELQFKDGDGDRLMRRVLRDL
jgi:tetraacyldisaccharide 4'-kinase